MSRTLVFMEEADRSRVATMVEAMFSPRGAACEIGWQHDGERLVLTVETDVLASEIGEMYRKTVIPLLAALEAEFGEFVFELRSLCACGEVATPMVSDNPEHDMCLCGQCLDRSIDKHRAGPRNTCPVCERGFDGFENPGWRVSCSAKFVSEEGGAEPEMDIGTVGGTDSTPMSRWECCSRECALKQFRAWLSEVESHRVTKEARP